MKLHLLLYDLYGNLLIINETTAQPDIVNTSLFDVKLLPSGKYLLKLTGNDYVKEMAVIKN